jgi:ABC-2 type transport system ATP-binding protein
MSPSELAIEARGLGKDYGSLTAVGAVDLEVHPGEFFGLLGPNGAGKTTTIHMLATLLRPSRGTGRVAGHDVVRSPLAVRRQIGLVFQETTLDLDLTAEENLRFAARLYALPSTEARRRIDEVLDLFDLAPRRHDRVRSFSGGMRRALDLARGVLHRPGILFLDEPTLGLDPIHRRRIWKFLHRLRSESGVTLFLTTHHLEEADDCERVVILDRGRILVRGTPAELKRRVGHESLELEADPADDGLIDEVRRRTGVEPQRSARGLVVAVADAETVLSGLLPLLNGRIRALRVRRPSLEDVFVALTGHPTDIERSG